MEPSRRAGLAIGLILVLLGACFLVIELVPALRWWVYGAYGWPLSVIGAGVLLLFIGILTGAHGLAVPAAIVGGIGALLFWQNATNNWDSWAYAWALIPSFVGVGVMLAGVLQGRWRALWEGAWLVLIGLVLFALFGSLFGGLGIFGPYWPVLLIAWGLLALGRGLVRLAR